MDLSRYRHLDVSGLERCHDAIRTATMSGQLTQDTARQIAAEYSRELAKLRRQAMLRPVPVNGDFALGRRMGYFEQVLQDGSRAYFQRRVDDCVQASIASLAGVPMDQVPDLRLDEKLAAGIEFEEVARNADRELEQWAEQNGLTITVHPTPPRSAKRWIGVVRLPSEGFNDHCLIMSRNKIIWDTSAILPPSEALPLAPWMEAEGLTVADIDFGITIE